MKNDLDLSPEVDAALKAGKPVVALESTIISHGMPWPQNEETALRVEAAVRETGATPATIATPLSPDTLTITLDTISKLLIVNGYSREDYILPLIGREGNYHCLEISLYQSFLKRNIALRAERYVTSAQKTTITH